MEKYYFYIIVLVGLLLALSFALNPSKPANIVVNMSKDALPLERLTNTEKVADAKIVTSEKAVLWWTVFKLAMDKGWRVGTAANAADQAVKACYPEGAK